MWGLVRAYWRIPVIALLGGLIAFGGSFIAAEKYSSTTRVLIRGREATFLTTSGTDLSQAPGVIDASLAKSLACLLYTSDAADERSSVDLGGRRIIKKKNSSNTERHRRHTQKIKKRPQAAKYCKKDMKQKSCEER